MWSNVRVAAPDAKDAALDAKCAATNVEEEINLLRGVGAPLVLRPAFRALATVGTSSPAEPAQGRSRTGEGS